MLSNKLLAPGLFLATIFSTPIVAETQQAHEHGSAVLNMALDGNELSIQFLSPAMNIVGFEHEAKTQAEKIIIEQALATLKNPMNIVNLSELAACVLSKVDVDSSLSATEHADNEEHEEHEDSHGNFDVSYIFHCDKPQALTSIQAVVFKKFTDLDDIDVRFISETGQRSGEMSPENNSFLLK